MLTTLPLANAISLFAALSKEDQNWQALIDMIWEGAFCDIPVAGGWFSFKLPPQNKHHQSIILTNTLIFPSAMGMAKYYINHSNGYGDHDQFSQQAPSPSPLSKSMQPLPGVN